MTHQSELFRQACAAIHVGDVAGLAHCLDCGLPCDARDDVGNTLLMMASCVDALRCAKLLLDRGATYDLSNKEGMTPLGIAVARGNARIVQLMLGYPVDLDANIGSMNTAYLVAMMSGRRDIAMHLLASGADPDCRNADGLSGDELYQLSGAIE